MRTGIAHAQKVRLIGRRSFCAATRCFLYAALRMRTGIAHAQKVRFTGRRSSCAATTCTRICRCQLSEHDVARIRSIVSSFPFHFDLLVQEATDGWLRTPPADSSVPRCGAPGESFVEARSDAHLWVSFFDNCRFFPLVLFLLQRFTVQRFTSSSDTVWQERGDVIATRNNSSAFSQPV